jgi:hypothetical protein
MIDKLEVGQEYISVLSKSPMKCIGHDAVRGLFILVDSQGFYQVYDQEDIISLKLKEHTEPKTVSGYAIITVDGDGIVQFQTRLESLEYCQKYAKKYSQDQVIHLDNVIIGKIE